MIILGIETSCDETAVSVVKDKNIILSNSIYSHIPAHQKKGGIIPDVSSRLHAEKINHLIDISLKDAGCLFSDLSAVAVTNGPGLEGCLLVGVSAAKAIAYSCNIPLIPINHLKGHIYSLFLSKETTPPFPFINLLISGGNTLLCLVKNHDDISMIGTTRDDAVGEAFDKIGRYMGLDYPAGPTIERLAKTHNGNLINFPKPLIYEGLDFSFSGLKTAVIRYIQAHPDTQKEVICASLQNTISELLIYKSLKACKTYNCHHLAVNGGVSANKTLKESLNTSCKLHGIKLYDCPPILCTDNAAMIACAAFYEKDKFISPITCSVDSNATL